MPPGYAVEVLPAVEKDLDRLPRQIEIRIGERIDALAYSPNPSGAQAIAGKPGYFRIRIGDYRVVYRLDHTREWSRS